MSHSVPIGEERLAEVLVENAFDAIAKADDQILGGRDRSSLDRTHAWRWHRNLITSVYSRFRGYRAVFTPS